MTNTTEQVAPVTLDPSIYEHENEWVALDAEYRVIEHAERLPELLAKLTPEQEATKPTFMQVFPRGMSFVGSAL